MANKNQVLGQVKVKIDGDLLETDGQSTIELGGPSREAVEGDYQAGAFKTKTMPSKVEATLLLKAGLDIVALRDIDNATLTIEADIGGTYIVRNAYVAEVISFTTSDGKAKLVFMGPPAERV